MGVFNMDEQVMLSRSMSDFKDKKVTQIRSPETTNVKEVIDAVAQAMENVDGMAFKGDIKGSTQVGEVELNGTTEVTGMVTFRPYAQYVSGQTISDEYGIEDIKMYTADDKTYSLISPNDWMVTCMGTDSIAGMLSEEHFRNFSKHWRAFKLVNKDNHYLLSFSADESKFNDIAYGGIIKLWGKEIYDSVINMFESVSGSYQFTIDKQTFQVTSLYYQKEMIIKGGFTCRDKGTYTYSEFNEVPKVVVPEEVIESSYSLNDLDTFEIY